VPADQETEEGRWTTFRSHRRRRTRPSAGRSCCARLNKSASFSAPPLSTTRQPRAVLRGAFVYERKRKNDSWEPTNSVSLKAVKAGEEYKLELHAAEVLALMDAIGPLYRWK
jgi:hypothetical protein